MIADSFDVVVVGGGHAGIEATHASWKLGVRTAMLTMDVSAIGRIVVTLRWAESQKGRLSAISMRSEASWGFLPTGLESSSGC